MAVAALCAAVALVIDILMIGAAIAQTSTTPSEIAFNQTPPWVERMSLPGITEDRVAQSQDGVHYLIFDTQTLLTDGDYTFYRRSAQKIINRTGLESAARLRFAFDPVDTAFYVHTVNVIRDGKIINRLDPSAFLVTRQETELASGVTDGELTVYAEIQDVRVGDVVDYEVSWKTRSILWPGEFSYDFSIEWSVPLERFRNRIILPVGRALNIKNVSAETQPVITKNAGSVEYVWSKTNPAPLRGQELVPQSYSNWSFVSASTFERWENVTDSLVSAYDEAAVLRRILPVIMTGFLDKMTSKIKSPGRYGSFRTIFDTSLTRPGLVHICRARQHRFCAAAGGTAKIKAFC